MERVELYNLNLRREVFVVELWKYPYRSKERADLWNEIAANLDASNYSKFKVS